MSSSHLSHVALHFGVVAHLLLPELLLRACFYVNGATQILICYDISYFDTVVPAQMVLLWLCGHT